METSPERFPTWSAEVPRAASGSEFKFVIVQVRCFSFGIRLIRIFVVCALVCWSGYMMSAASLHVHDNLRSSCTTPKSYRGAQFGRGGEKSGLPFVLVSPSLLSVSGHRFSRRAPEGYVPRCRSSICPVCRSSPRPRSGPVTRTRLIGFLHTDREAGGGVVWEPIEGNRVLVAGDGLAATFGKLD